MTAPHPFVAIRSRDQWRRTAHTNTVLTVKESGVTLARQLETENILPVLASAEPNFMAFDPYCRLLALSLENGQLLLCRDIDLEDGPNCVSLLDAKAPAVGEFNWAKSNESEPAQPQHYQPSGLTVDCAGNLFLSEADADRIAILDLSDRRFIRFAQLPFGSSPGDSDADGLDVYLTTTQGLGKLNVAAEFKFLSGVLAGRPFDRVAVSGGLICVLENAGTADAKVIPWQSPEDIYDAPFASDIVFSDTQTLVIAYRAGELFEQHKVAYSRGNWTRIKKGYLRAKGYDGRAIVRSPHGRVGYFSDTSFRGNGFRYALPSKTKFQRRGRVISFALDSGAYQNKWGLAFVDACIPRGCDVRVHFYTSDDLDVDFPLLRTTAGNDSEYGDLLAPERSPAMPTDTAFPSIANTDIRLAAKLYRRGVDDELVWSEYSDNPSSATYETPVISEPGRYLWVAFELLGTGKAAPVINSLRVQKQGHNLLNQLPKLFSRDQESAAFLRRYLALPEAILTEFDVAALTRHVLLDPYSCREDWLVWLAGFMGLAFDERFNPDTRRQLISEAAWLFRFRGTVQGLQRYIQIYADFSLGFGTVVQIIERFRFRGHAGLEDPDTADDTNGTVLGVDYRLGSGVAGAEQGEFVETQDTEPFGERSDPYAHRFVVLIAANLSTDQFEVIDLIIRLNRPAHTAFEVCTVDAGMRISRGSYLQINSFVGQSAGFMPIHLDSGTLGRNGVLGTPKTASTSSGGQIGRNARLG